MKNLLKIGLLVSLALILCSCGDKREVKKVSKQFLQSYYVDNDFEAAKDLSTPATHETLDFKAMMFMLNPNSESEDITSFRIEKIEMLKTKAVCFYEVIDNELRRINLSKINDKWLVDMPENVMIEPGLSLSQTKNAGGFASAESEPVRLKDIPENK